MVPTAIDEKLLHRDKFDVRQAVLTPQWKF
jgi:hypothetical protein